MKRRMWRCVTLRKCRVIALRGHDPTIGLPDCGFIHVKIIERQIMSDGVMSTPAPIAASVGPVAFIHQILPRSFHDLVARLRQETARADVAGDSGNPVLVIGVAVTLVPQGGALCAVVPLHFLVEGQSTPLWTAPALFDRIKGTPAEAALFALLRAATGDALPLDRWTPPPALGLSAAHALTLTVLGSVTVIAPEGQDAALHRWTACLQQAQTEIEALELPLRAASDLRRFAALARTGDAGIDASAAMPEFSGLTPLAL